MMGAALGHWTESTGAKVKKHLERRKLKEDGAQRGGAAQNIFKLLLPSLP